MPSSPRAMAGSSQEYSGFHDVQEPYNNTVGMRAVPEALQIGLGKKPGDWNQALAGLNPQELRYLRETLNEHVQSAVTARENEEKERKGLFASVRRGIAGLFKSGAQKQRETERAGRYEAEAGRYLQLLRDVQSTIERQTVGMTAAQMAGRPAATAPQAAPRPAMPAPVRTPAPRPAMRPAPIIPPVEPDFINGVANF